MKLNVGCGTDYREGFVNIDGSSELPKIDKVIDISKEPLSKYFSRGEVKYILANDIIEHHFHWEAVKILEDFYSLLASGGKLEIRVPDAEYIIKTWRIPLEKKLVMLYGGQDIGQGINAEMDESRKFFPEYFCHKFGWTRSSMKAELSTIGFSQIKTKRANTNFVAHAVKV